MGGQDELRGLIYQQKYATYRAFEALGSKVLGTQSDKTPVLGFSIEGRTVANAPVWDVILKYEDGGVDLDECKDTAITREARETFYHRIRKELANGTSAKKIRPTWITDPDKQTPNILKYLDGIASAMASRDLSTVANARPSRVDSVEDAIQEAVYHLCHEDLTDGPPLCRLEDAKDVLAQLQIIRHSYQQLEKSVGLLATSLFTKGTGTAVATYVTGVLTQKIIAEGEAKLTIDGFLEAIGAGTVELEAEGRIRRLLTFSAASGYTPVARRIRWSELTGAPVTTWQLRDRLPDFEPDKSMLVVGPMGIGKTVASQMAFQDQATRRDPTRVLRIEARSLEVLDLEALVRLTSMLAGSGHVWIAIDGLDEIPQDLRTAWEQTLGALLSLPNLTVFATVRGEVLVVREWILEVTASLARVTISALSRQQVEDAFLNVGLAAPTNTALLRALETPFLLSLYADIVSPDDMPLSQSGEVTAFRVIDEFWHRRVRAPSTGQRAVGDSELSQETKRQAVIYLGDKTLAGDIVLRRSASDSTVEAGIEMLLREGVVVEAGAGAVTWRHEWLREYAIVDRLLSQSESRTPAALAHQIAACSQDQVARVAAAGGVKWIVANPDCGTAADYLKALNGYSPALAREALIVLLEGRADDLILQDLDDDLLYEAILLAVHVKAIQWSEQVRRLEDERFLSEGAYDLHNVTVQYELEIAPYDSQDRSSAIVKLTARDLRRIAANRPVNRGTARLLLNHIAEAECYQESPAVEWMKAIARISQEFEVAELMKVAAKMAVAQEDNAAHDIFRCSLGFDDSSRLEVLTGVLCERHSLYGREVADVLHVPNLLSRSASTWGCTAIEFLEKLNESRQKKDWPSHVRFLRSISGVEGSQDSAQPPFQPRYDQDCRRTNPRDQESVIALSASAIETAFRELVLVDDSSQFTLLATRALGARYSSIVGIPLLALYDSFSEDVQEKQWWIEEAVRLLSDAAVNNLHSLGDVRRLLRRRLASNLIQPQKERIVAAIRQADMSPEMRSRELADIQMWGMLSAQELASIDSMLKAGRGFAPRDSRTEPTVTSIPQKPPSATPLATGWPYSEDDALVRLLIEGETEGDGTHKDDRLTDAESRRLEAIASILQRPESLSQEWIGRTLAWCSGSIRALKRIAKEEAHKTGHTRIEPSRWQELLATNAPWWQKIVDAAIKVLNEHLPASHSKQDLADSRLSWNSMDPVLNALEVLAAVLSIDGEAPFDEPQEKLVTTIAARWTTWPPFTKATSLSCLPPRFWMQFPRMRSLLSGLIVADSPPVLMNYAVECLVALAPNSSTPELGAFLELVADKGGHDEALRTLSELLGHAAMETKCGGASSHALALSELLAVGLRLKWVEAASECSFLAGVLDGAMDFVAHAGVKTPGLANSLIDLTSEALAAWPFDRTVSVDAPWFPVRLIERIFGGDWSSNDRTLLFQRLGPVFEALLRQGSLADYCGALYYLKRLTRGTQRADGLLPLSQCETELIRLCRASVERVVEWKQQKKVTNDLGWGSGLDGRDAVEFAKHVFDLSRDRGRARGELLPLADVLADAGLHRVAAELRIHLRRV